MSMETNAVVELPVDLFVYCMSRCANVCACFDLCVCVFVRHVCFSFSGPPSALSGPWRCGL